MIRTLSIYDAMQVPELAEAIRKSDAESFKKHLHYLGFDIEKEIKEDDYFHRPMFTGTEVKFGKVFSGMERTDLEWVNSGKQSFDNRMELALARDESLSSHLVEMCEFPEIADMMMRHARGEIGLFEEDVYKEQQ